jgi:hypothetical protein
MMMVGEDPSDCSILVSTVCMAKDSSTITNQQQQVLQVVTCVLQVDNILKLLNILNSIPVYADNNLSLE